MAEATLSTRSEFRIAASEQDLLRAEIDCCYHRACIFTEMGSFDSSIRYFQRGWDLVQRLGSSSPDPGSPHPWSVDQMRYGLCGGIANSLNGLGKNLESLEKYNECLALKPNDNSTIYEVNRCRCQLAIGMLDEAHAGLVSFIKKRREEEDAMKSGGMSHHSFM